MRHRTRHGSRGTKNLVIKIHSPPCGGAGASRDASRGPETVREPQCRAHSTSRRRHRSPRLAARLAQRRRHAPVPPHGAGTPRHAPPSDSREPQRLGPPEDRSGTAVPRSRHVSRTRPGAPVPPHGAGTPRFPRLFPESPRDQRRESETAVGIALTLRSVEDGDAALRSQRPAVFQGSSPRCASAWARTRSCPCRISSRMPSLMASAGLSQSRLRASWRGVHSPPTGRM